MRTIWNSRWSTGPNYSLEEKLKIYKIHPYISLLTLVKIFIWDIIFLTLDVQFESVSYNGVHLFPQARILSKNVYEHLPQLIIYGPYIICNTNFRNISVVLFQELCLNNVEWWADGKNKRWQHERKEMKHTSESRWLIRLSDVVNKSEASCIEDEPKLKSPSPSEGKLVLHSWSCLWSILHSCNNFSLPVSTCLVLSCSCWRSFWKKNRTNFKHHVYWTIISGNHLQHISIKLN